MNLLKDKMKIRVLIVEDDPLQLNALICILELNNVFVIGTSNSVDQAALMIEKYSPDLVFLDIELNNETRFENGLNLITKIYKQKKQPIIAIFTSYFIKYAIQSAELKNKFFNKEIYYLNKPYELDKIKEVISEIKIKIGLNINGFFSLKTEKKEIELIPYINIIEIRRWEDKYCKIIYLKNNELFEADFAGEFSEVVEKLKYIQGFVFARQATLINCFRIVKINQEVGVLEIEIPYLNNSTKKVVVSEKFMPIWKQLFNIKRA